MTQRTTVVENTKALTKQGIHAKLMCGWSRGVSRYGKGTFADILQITSFALDKQLAGSMPCMEVIDRALDHEPTVLDDYFAAKGKRLAELAPACDANDTGLLLARALVAIHEAEHPGGPGGGKITHREYLELEQIMRDLQATSTRWVDKCAEIRQPRAVS